MALLRVAVCFVLLIFPSGAEAAGRALHVPTVFFTAACGGKAGFLVYGGQIEGCFAPGGASFRSKQAEITLRFLGANRHARLEGISPVASRLTIVHGAEPQSSQSTSEAYMAIRYAGLYPGIDAIYRGGALKSEFNVSPGADASVIRYRYGGISKPYLDLEGNLILAGVHGNVREHAPSAYQEREGTQVPVPASYRINADGSIGFQIATYNPEYPLVIDPVLEFSTFYDGSGIGVVTAIAVDATGNTYFAGYTESANLLVLNPLRSKSGGGVDAFVAKLDSLGQLVYATYLGGRGDDRAFGLAIDGTGSVVATGWTASPDFPVANAYQQTLAGGRNAFVARLNPAGNGLIYSTFFGGSGQSSGNAIALDTAGNAYVSGDTTSSNFPVRTPAQSVPGGQQDAYVAKFTAFGSLIFSTYFGGSGDDRATAIAVNQSGEAYVAGSTKSIDLQTVSPIQPALRGVENAFIMKLNAAGFALLYSTYLGGGGGRTGAPEFATGIAVDMSGAAYVVGATSSIDFPTAAAMYSSLRQGDTDAFVIKINPAGTALVYSTYLGGSGFDQANAIAVDTSGTAYVAGHTFSDDFPLVSPAQGRGGDYDAFVAVVNPAGTALLFSTYLGGSASDSANAIALDSNRDVYVGGQSFSYNFPLIGAIQNGTVAPGGTLTKFAMHPKPVAVSVTPSSGSGNTQVFSFLASDAAGASDLSETYVVFRAGTGSPMCYIAVVPPGSIYLMNDSLTLWNSPISIGSAATVENSQCRVNASGSSITTQTTNQTLTLSLTFKAAFAGTKTISLSVQSASDVMSTSTVGTWVVGGPSVLSITPNSGSGARQVFSFTSSDPAGAADIAEDYIGFSSTSGTLCYAAVIPPSTIYLLNDAANAWLGPISAGTAATVSNSQCSVTAAGSSITSSGNNQVLNLDVTFKPAFAGSAVLVFSIRTSDGTFSPARYANWNVPALQNPTAISISPSSGSGGSQVFSFATADPLGAANLYRTFVYVQGANSRLCALTFIGPNSLYLLDDSATYWLPPITIGSNASVANSQCRVKAASSSTTSVGNTQTLTLDLSFDRSFRGSQIVSLQAQNFGGLFSNAVYGGWIVY